MINNDNDVCLYEDDDKLINNEIVPRSNWWWDSRKFHGSNREGLALGRIEMGVLGI